MSKGECNRVSSQYTKQTDWYICWERENREQPDAGGEEEGCWAGIIEKSGPGQHLFKWPMLADEREPLYRSLGARRREKEIKSGLTYWESFAAGSDRLITLHSRCPSTPFLPPILFPFPSSSFLSFHFHWPDQRFRSPLPLYRRRFSFSLSPRFIPAPLFSYSSSLCPFLSSSHSFWWLFFPPHPLVQ